MTTSSHGAAASALGYQFQTWWCLLELLRAGLDRPDAAISLELHDDVAWEQQGSPTELLQVKHHVVPGRSLADTSVDVWRTIAVWLDSPAGLDPHGPLLHLVTTDEAPAESAAYLLRQATRDEPLALERLLEAATTSTAEATRAARERFIALDPSDREALVAKVSVVDQAVTIENVDYQARRVLGYALPTGHEDLFMRLLWGWWDREAVRMLRGLRGSMRVEELTQQINELRDQFTQDRLPTLVDLRDLDQEELARQYDQHVFVHQLRWVDFPPLNLQRAVVDYFRAYSQTQQWVDEDLIATDELDRFEAELIDEWQREFEFMVLELPDLASEEDKKQAGLALLRQLLASTAVKVRERYDDVFFMRGKRHELADRQLLGWHPDFAGMLRALLVPADATS